MKCFGRTDSFVAKRYDLTRVAVLSGPRTKSTEGWRSVDYTALHSTPLGFGGNLELYRPDPDSGALGVTTHPTPGSRVGSDVD